MNVDETNTTAAESEGAPAPITEGVLVTPPPQEHNELAEAAEQPEGAQASESDAPAPVEAASDDAPQKPEEDSAVADDTSDDDVIAPLMQEAEARLRRHHVAPAMIAIDRIDEDGTFRVRPEGDISLLATDIARLGQLFPVDIRLKPPDRFQIITGFRRVAALRFLQRDRVLARLHTDLADEDALLMALVSAIHARPVAREELEQVKARLEGEGRLSPAIRSMLDKALSPDDDLAPESVDGEQEVDADELATDVTLRLGEINQDLSLLADAFDSLDRAKQDELLQQLRYSSDLVAFLEGKR